MVKPIIIIIFATALISLGQLNAKTGRCTPSKINILSKTDEISFIKTIPADTTVNFLWCANKYD